MRNTTDRYPKTTVGSDGYLHITTPFPVIGVPDAGCIKHGERDELLDSKQKGNIIISRNIYWF